MFFLKGNFLQTFCGSPLYASPEIVNGRPYRGPEVDTWSLGVLLYTLVHGNMPFDGNNHKTLVQQISTGNYRKPNNPSDACGLIRWMLMVNPERRATIEEIAGHWWLNWGYQQPLLCETKNGVVDQSVTPPPPPTPHSTGLTSSFFPGVYLIISFKHQPSGKPLESGSSCIFSQLFLLRFWEFGEFYKPKGELCESAMLMYVCNWNLSS
uniref:non-specific serine/threonine protein kinase n=1 Tax=Oryzias sinensis TaxID=183150 RepID=A0A8C7XDX1_9TELE